MAIVRGRIYHTFSEDFQNWKKAKRHQGKTGLKVKELETQFAEYIGRKHCVAYSFARSAMYHALQALNLPPGSEIIMPPITIKPMVDVVLQCGHKPIFVDISLKDYCFDLEDLKQNITPNTQAAIITYLFGVVPEVQALTQLLQENKITIIEDFSHCLNAESNGTKLGNFSTIAIYSTSAMKTLDTYGGGLLLVDDEDLHNQLRTRRDKMSATSISALRRRVRFVLIRNLLTQPLAFSLITRPLLHLVKMFNPVLHQKLTGARLGLKPVEEFPEEWNDQYTELQAETGLRHLELVEERDRERIDNVHWYFDSLSPQARERLVQGHNGTKNVYWQLPIIVKDSEAFIKFMASRGIDTGSSNLSLCSQLDIYPQWVKETPNAAALKNRGMFIPIYGSLTQTQKQHIVNTINDYFNLYETQSEQTG